MTRWCSSPNPDRRGAGARAGARVILSAMPIELSPSGRSTCRTCRKPIARDSLRYSEQIVIAASDQPGFRNYHPMCAAEAHVRGFQEALEAYEGPVPEREALLAALAADGKKKQRVEAPVAPDPEAPFEQLVADAHAALDAGRHPEALRALVAVWRQAPEPEMAAAITEQARRMEAVKPLAGKTYVQQDEDFDARLAAHDPVELPLLLQYAVWTRASVPAVATRLLHSLATMPPDPRITDVIVAALRTPRFAPGSEAWGPVFELLARNGDPRTLTLLDEVDFAASFGDLPLADGVLARREKLRARFQARAAATPEVAEAARRLAERVVPKSAHDSSALEAQVLAEPHRDDLRGVLQDSWLQNGDPRGEHVMLCELAKTKPLTEEELKRRREIEQKHWNDWSAPFQGLIRIEAADRGFPSRGQLEGQYSPELLHKLLELPAWNTLVALDLYWVGDRPFPKRLLQRLGAASLREVRVRTHHVAALAGLAPTWLTDLTLMPGDSTPAIRSEPFPALERLRVMGTYDRPARFDAFFGSPILSQLKVLTINRSSDDPVSVWLHAATRQLLSERLPVPCVEITWGAARFAFTRAESRWDLALHLPQNGRSDPKLAAIEAQLGAFEEASLGTVSVDGRLLDKKQQQSMRSAIGPRAVSVVFE